MKVLSATVGLPVSDLQRSIGWYRRVLELPEPELEPAESVMEFHVGHVGWRSARIASRARVPKP